MPTRVLKACHRRTWRMLAGLRECWEQDRPLQHAQATGLVLGQMVANPDQAADALLPILIRFISSRGPQGVDSLFLTALSAAARRNPAIFDEAVALADQIAEEGTCLAPKDGFVIHFVDLGVIPGFAPDQLVAAKNTGPRLHHIPGITRSHAARRPLGDAYVSSLIGVSYPDGIRNAAYADGVGTASQMLPGFGPALRNSLHKHDRFILPDRGVSRDHAKEVNKYLATAILAAIAHKTITALSLASGVSAVALSGLAGAILYEGGSWLVGAVVIGEGTDTSSGPTDAGPPAPAAGVIDDPDEETKMPIPGEAPGGSTSPLDLLNAALRYLGRLDPLINPTQEDLGHGYVAVHMPQPGNIDPLWADVRTPRPREEDVLAWLAFIQAKYFDALVNPVR